MKKLLTLLCPIIMLAVMASCSQQRNDTGGLPPDKALPAANTGESIELFAMNTYMTVTANGTQAKSALTAVESRIRELETLWSVTDADSEIYRVNHSGGAPVAVDEATEKVISFALDMAERTGGALEPTIYPVLISWGFTTGSYRIPAQAELDVLLADTGYEKVIINNGQVTLPEGMQLDLGAVAKGYTADIVEDILRDHGVTSALIDLGGNIQLLGAKPDGSKWRVGIKDAYGDGNVGVLAAADCAIVTSGGYERYFIGDDGKTYWHILDPSTGRPANSGLISVTVVGQEGRVCDALSTALFVMGLDDAAEHWRTYRDFEMILMTEDNKLYITEGLESDFTLSQSHAGMKVQVLTR